jgi:methyltransferase (TIGR00027 family)
MREGKPSLTAAFVAFGRGVGLSNDQRDILARELSPLPFSAALGLLDARTRWPARLAARAATLGLADHASLRMAAIDDGVKRAASDGVEQLVLLGAGLDTRAWRMPELGAMTVFEVDHPSTQTYKRPRVEAWRPLSREVRFVSVDFERQALGAALEEAGHDETLPTVWVWEGVTMYLEAPAIDATLGEVDRRTAPRSRLLMTYITPRVLAISSIAENLALTAFEVLGEPLIGLMETAEVARRLLDAAFVPVSDTDSLDWARRHGGNRILPAAFRTERLVEARREAR